MNSVCVIECDLCECQGLASAFYPWDQINEMEAYGWAFVTGDGRLEAALCPHCVAIMPANIRNQNSALNHGAY